MQMEQRHCYSAKKMEPVYFPIRGKTVFMAMLCYAMAMLFLSGIYTVFVRYRLPHGKVVVFGVALFQD
jgi:hypothetical protein